MQTFSKEASLLLISPDGNWQKIVHNAWANAGKVDMEVDLEQALQRISVCLSRKRPYELIIMDVWATPDIAESIAAIRQLQPDVRIVVASAGPTWKQAREAFDAGAVDFIVKSLDAGELQTSLQRARHITPPWRTQIS
ncbi:MAG: response regulator [Chloroflexi bacterium]|nr:response regulator [Chloroflexota bacterium]